MHPPISVCIIGYNEEKKIQDCLKSILLIADEIIYVDSGSTDKTIEIVKRYTEKIYFHKFINYVDQKNFAIHKARNDWILSLDCDERLSQKAIQAIQKEWKSESYKDLKAFSFRRLTYYIYRWIRHSGWYPDRNVRLFDKRKCQWGGTYIHEYVDCKNLKIKKIDADILHYSFDSISDHLKKIEKFSSYAAEEAFKKGRKSGPFTIIFRSLIVGIKKIFLEFSFLDGTAGIILTGLSMAATWSKYSKLYILQKSKKENDFLTRNKINF